MRARSLVAAAASAVAMLLAACGDDESGSALRDAVPADAALYAEAVVRPEGDVKEDVDELLERFGAESPGPGLIEEIDGSLQEDGSSLTYEDDIEPWLGERAAIWLAPEAFAESEPDQTESSAGIIETTDEGAAEDFLRSAFEESAEDEPYEEATYEGQDYLVDSEGVAGGIVDGLLVIGGEPAFQAVVDTAETGEGLAGEDRFADALPADEADEALASLYVDVESAIDGSGVREGPEAAELEQLEEIAPALLTEPVVAYVELDDETVTLDATYGSFGALATFVGLGGDSDAIGGLPESAWGAVSNVDLGEGYLEVLTEFGGVQGVDEGEIRTFEREVERRTELTLEEALSAIGDVALFVSGESLLTVAGGAVVEIRDDAAGDEMFAAIERAIAADAPAPVRPLALPGAEGFSLSSPEVPQPVNFARADGRWVIAYGDEATQEALEPSAMLADAPGFQSAADALGDDVTLNTFFEIEPALTLISAAAPPAEFAEARPYLEHLDFLAMGGADDGETGRFRLAVGTK